MKRLVFLVCLSLLSGACKDSPLPSADQEPQAVISPKKEANENPAEGDAPSAP